MSINWLENQMTPPAPLHPIPAIGQSFERVIIDCVSPLPRSKSGNQYLLTIMCNSTRYPKAAPLHSITAAAVVKALLRFFLHLGSQKYYNLIEARTSSQRPLNRFLTLFRLTM